MESAGTLSARSCDDASLNDIINKSSRIRRKLVWYFVSGNEGSARKVSEETGINYNTCRRELSALVKLNISVRTDDCYKLSDNMRSKMNRNGDVHNCWDESEKAETSLKGPNGEHDVCTYKPCEELDQRLEHSKAVFHRVLNGIENGRHNAEQEPAQNIEAESYSNSKVSKSESNVLSVNLTQQTMCTYPEKPDSPLESHAQNVDAKEKALKLLSVMNNRESSLVKNGLNSEATTMFGNPLRYPNLFNGELKGLLRYSSFVTWINSLRNEKTACTYAYQFYSFLEGLRTRPELDVVDPDVLLEIQRKLRVEDRKGERKTVYHLWDSIIKPYIESLPRTYYGKQNVYTAIKSFFACNREPLPEDEQFEVTSVVPPREAQLSLEGMRKIAQAAAVFPKVQSMYLVKVQGFMGEAELDYVNRNLGRKIYLQVMAGADLIRIDFSGRKSTRNKPQSKFYTFIMKDAIDSLRRYFDSERGEVREGEPIWVSGKDKKAYYRIFSFGNAIRRIVKRLFYKKTEKKGYYGFNLHETRDVTLTHAHTYKSKGFDIDCARFWAGHGIDRNKYEKMFHPEMKPWVESQYRMLGPLLNLISGPKMVEETFKEQEEKVQSLQELSQHLEQRNRQMEERFRNLEEKYETLLGLVKLKERKGKDVSDKN